MKRIFVAFAASICLLLFPVVLSGQVVQCNFGLLKAVDADQWVVSSTSMVPYTEMKKETYQVQIPETEPMEQTYEVMVPYTETVTENGQTKTVTRTRKEKRTRKGTVKRQRTETRERTVPVTRIRTEVRSSLVPAKTKIKTIDGKEVDRAELRKSIGKGKFVLILKDNEKLTENHKAVLKPDTLVLRIESKSP